MVGEGRKCGVGGSENVGENRADHLGRYTELHYLLRVIMTACMVPLIRVTPWTTQEPEWLNRARTVLPLHIRSSKMPVIPGTGSETN